MSCGKLTKILLHAKVTRYLEFKSIDGSYVYKDSKVQKVPGTSSYHCIHIRSTHKPNSFHSPSSARPFFSQPLLLRP